MLVVEREVPERGDVLAPRDAAEGHRGEIHDPVMIGDEVGPA